MAKRKPEAKYNAESRGHVMSQTPHISPFDGIRHEDEHIGEYWSARELYKILGYTEWRNFNSVVIKRAMKACEENGRAVSEHFVRSYKMSKTGQGGQRKTEDVLLSRYAAYLVVMNGDPKMPIVAMGQEYFAEQTRRQELAAAQADAIEALPEDQNRLYRRAELSIQNVQSASLFFSFLYVLLAASARTRSICTATNTPSKSTISATCSNISLISLVAGFANSIKGY